MVGKGVFAECFLSGAWHSTKMKMKKPEKNKKLFLGAGGGLPLGRIWTYTLSLTHLTS